jgi:hypothetical protein
MVRRERAASDALLCRRIEAQARFGNQSAIAIDHLADDEESHSVVRAFDRAVLAQALRDSQQALNQGNKYVAVVPLHAASLKSEPDRQWISGRPSAPARSPSKADCA